MKVKDVQESTCTLLSISRFSDIIYQATKSHWKQYLFFKHSFHSFPSPDVFSARLRGGWISFILCCLCLHGFSSWL